ncbi:MAG: YeeE/YedE thiosulfate transporter family protein [Elusimicrobia bacterium]|nr:YeeE/YedE thiosulfate transporter family protein [Elusimicrobiota bacterium]
MGPLVPDIISNNLNYLVALGVGLLFGMVLEQAGFSSTRKLVGLFYGYDFTVLRVFFTAGVTAMLGVIGLEHFGLLDMSLVYINPTFLWAAIVGGLIMGLGFVVGGFCPGTSICAAAIGKLDAMVFIGGAFLGVFIFAEGYPLFVKLYMAAPWGSPQVFDSLRISQSLFAFLLVLAALGAFWAVSIIENRVNGVKRPAVRFTPYYAGLGAAGLVLAAAALLMPSRKASLLEASEAPGAAQAYKADAMTPDEFALRLMDGGDKMRIVDFRPEEARAKMPLPGSVPFTAGGLFEKQAARTLLTRGLTYVFAAEDEQTERRMAFIADRLGFRDIRILEGGLKAFRDRILDFKPAAGASAFERDNAYRFREEAKRIVPGLLKAAPAEPAVKKAKRILGGC